MIKKIDKFKKLIKKYNGKNYNFDGYYLVAKIIKKRLKDEGMIPLK